MINLANYEEWFVLYMDDELNAVQKTMVENFVLQHPHLQEELHLLLRTKLPVDEVGFAARESLLSGAMKLNTIDESLLLYIDQELPAAEKRAVEEKINTDETYRLQYTVLQQTKLDAAATIACPHKQTLYRHTKTRIFFPAWMRIAVAVVLLLFAALFVVFDSAKQQQAQTTGLADNKKPVQKKTSMPPSITHPETVLPQEPAIALHTAANTQSTNKPEAKTTLASAPENKASVAPSVSVAPIQTALVAKIETDKVNAAQLLRQPAVAVNNLIANPAVTSATGAAYNPIENPEEPATTDGDFKDVKRSSAKGFLRKVSRFIERRTGIGTANADDEILVGAVALKLN